MACCCVDEIVDTNSPRPSVLSRKDERQREQQPDAAPQRDLEPQQGDAPARATTSIIPTSAYGSSLPRISSHRRSGVTFSCSSVPSSFSRTMPIADRLVVIIKQQQREDAGDHEVAALEARVEPDADARVDAAARRAAPRPAGAACERQLLRVAGDQVRRVAEADVGRVRVAAVGDHLHGLRPSGAERLAVPGGNRQRHPRAAALEIRIDLVHAGDDVDHGEVGRRPRTARSGRGSPLDRSPSATTTGTLRTSVVAA